MKTIYKYRQNFNEKPKKVTKKSLVERFGVDYVKRITNEAKQCYMNDPYTLFELGNGISIHFE